MESQCLLNYDTLSMGEEHRVYLLVRVKGVAGDEARQQLPLNLSLVIDRSGSMQGQKLEFVKQASVDLVRRLGPKDRLSLVAYDTTVQVLITPRQVEEKKPFEQAVQRLRLGRTTNLSGGWLQGCDFVGEAYQQGCVNRVLLLTDGLANVGIQDPTSLAAMSRQKRAEGITTTTLGVGRGFNEDLLSGMANEGGGAFYFIDSPDQAPAFFSEELQDLYNVVGQNLTIAIDPGQQVRSIQQLYDYPKYEERGVLLYKLGDIYAEEERNQVIELALAPLEAGETRLGQIIISYDAIHEDQVERKEEAFEILVTAVPKSELEVKLPRIDVEKMALLQKTARARERAVQHADRGEFGLAASVLREIVELIEASEIEDEDLQAEHDRLLEDAMDMELGEQRYDTHHRKRHHFHVESAHRHQRHKEMYDEMHMRHKLMKRAIERNGPPPDRITWEGGSLALVGDRWVIGSAPDCDIVLQDTRVWPNHCSLERERTDWILHDLNSREGTFANAGLVEGRFRLSAGDVVTVGKSLFRFHAKEVVITMKGGDERAAVESIKHGQELEKSGDFQGAIKCYLQAIAHNPTGSMTRYFANNNLGYSLNQVGEFQEAEGYCRTAISIDGLRHNAHKNLGVSLEGQGKVIEAAEAYLTAVENGPSDGRALYHLEKLYQAHPEIGGQVSDFEKRLKRCQQAVLKAGGAIH